MAKNSRAIPTWAIYPGIALIAFVVWRKFSTGQSAADKVPTAWSDDIYFAEQNIK